MLSDTSRPGPTVAAARAPGVLRAVCCLGAALVAVVVLADATSADLWIQDQLYDSGEWLVDRHEPRLRLLLYTLPKYLLAIGAAGCLAVCLGSRKLGRLAPHVRGCSIVLLSLAVVPGAVGLMKSLTHVATPAQITRYGGSRPYRGVVESIRAQEPGARGFPAGHASGGFALISLYLALPFAWRRAGLGLGLGPGLLMGTYQTVNGQHFASHMLVTVLVAAILVLGIGWLYSEPFPRAASGRSASSR